jgi:hypothetical protein
MKIVPDALTWVGGTELTRLSGVASKEFSCVSQIAI